MAVVRWAKKRDTNDSEIFTALQTAGCSTQITGAQLEEDSVDDLATMLAGDVLDQVCTALHPVVAAACGSWVVAQPPCWDWKAGWAVRAANPAAP